ncbi:(+)-neomenthol dehydrogenase-like [Corylus avellana]|uniref:(+)-neomenthol dehydrogenase-like n=1 Tax=Corylus avellana TaxID=13451 RepID=UPI00286D1494|nr:(+)-neomenthol dehydrogenase-like [Corylus avellana]
MACEAEDQSPRFFVVVHVGTAYHAPSNEKSLRSAMKRACLAAALVLRKGSGSCLDAVSAAIQVLEDDPSTNAGRGSNLTEDGHVECDASIMDGDSGAFGAVGALPGIRNAIQIATLLAKDQIMGSSLLGRIPPIFLVGEGARTWAKSKGIALPATIAEADKWLVTERAKAQWKTYKVMVDDACGYFLQSTRNCRNTRYVVVTGSNKGIGFGICRQLASNGVVTVLTARDEKRGIEAVEKLKESGLSEYVVFHQLDVADPGSIASLANFIKTKYGKLDILVNNAGISGCIIDGDAFAAMGGGKEGATIDWEKIMTHTYELAEDCVRTNYYGCRRMVEALVPHLHLYNSPRIVNVSSFWGKLHNISNECAKGVFGDAESLTEERVDEVLSEFLKDFKEGSLKTKCWPSFLPAYKVSKAAPNAYTRIVAKKYPSFHLNYVCPGNVKTDINLNTGFLTSDEGAESAVKLTLLTMVLWRIL